MAILMCVVQHCCIVLTIEKACPIITYVNVASGNSHTAIIDKYC